MALANPALLARLELLPAEKMLASIDPGYPFLAVTSLLDTHLSNGSMYFVEYNADTPLGVAYGEALADPVLRLPAGQGVPQALRAAEARRQEAPVVRVVEGLQAVRRQEPAQHRDSRVPPALPEHRTGRISLAARVLPRRGYPTEIVSPDQLEYRAGVLRRGNFNLDLIYRRVKVQEFLLRYDLSHPLVRAYREGKVCMVNSFRSELAHKKAISTCSPTRTSRPASRSPKPRRFRQYVPWTRMVAMNKTSYQTRPSTCPTSSFTTARNWF